MIGMIGTPKVYKTELMRRAVRKRIIELARSLGFTWNKSSARYKSKATGRFVSEERVLSSMTRYSETAVRPTIDKITDRFINGNISLEKWQTSLAREVKDGILVSSMGGRGGRDQMTASDWGRTGGRIKYQMSKLDKFAADIASGQLTDAQIRARAAMYSRSSRLAYYDGLTAAKVDGEYLFERRFLQPGETCEDCEGYARQGKVTIGTLPEPGSQSECLSNCNCIKKYYKE